LNGGTRAQVLTKAMLPIVRPPFSNLIRNYRSHPAILAIPNALFYHDTLLVEAAETESLLSWRGWKGRGWPVLFSCNPGHDEIEQEGGGWFNMIEARKACTYAGSILSTGLIRPEDICVMAPFQAQVKRLRTVFRAMGLGQVNIGPMEAFQGLESRVVIICTTRSRARFMEQDQARGLGIIHEPKRFNVALTRAKQGLIVIGNPELLAQDSNWAAFLEYCRRNELWENTEPDLATGLTSNSEYWHWQPNALQQIAKADLPVLERALRFAQDGSKGKELGTVATYDDAMWVRGIHDALPSDSDNGIDGDELNYEEAHYRREPIDEDTGASSAETEERATKTKSEKLSWAKIAAFRPKNSVK